MESIGSARIDRSSGRRNGRCVEDVHGAEVGLGIFGGGGAAVVGFGRELVAGFGGDWGREGGVVRGGEGAVGTDGCGLGRGDQGAQGSESRW